MRTAPALTISAKDDLPVALVSGGPGFLKSFLCRDLLAKKIKVICAGGKGEAENISAGLDDKNFLFLENDPTKPLDKLERVDYIFHLGGPGESQEDKDATHNLLEVAGQSQAKFLFVSSADIPPRKSIAEAGEQTKSFSRAQDGQSVEAFITHYSKLHKINSRIVRVAEVYGPGMNLDAASVIARIIKTARDGEKLSFEGSRQEPSYPIFVEDAVEGTVKAMFFPNTAGKIYNLFGEKTTLSSFFEKARDASGKSGTIEFQKTSENETEILSPDDLEKTKEELGWSARVSLEEGLKKTFASPQPEDTAGEALAGSAETRVGEPVEEKKELSSSPDFPLIRRTEKTPLTSSNEDLPKGSGNLVEHLVDEKTSIAADDNKKDEKSEISIGGNLSVVGEKTTETSSVKEIIVEEQKISVFPAILRMFLSAILLISALAFPLLAVSWDVFWAQKNLAEISNGGFLSTEKIRAKAQAAESHFLSGREKIEDLGWLFELSGQQKIAAGWNEKLTIGERIAAGAKELAEAGGIFEGVGSAILGNGEVKSEDITKGKIHLAAALASWGEAEAKLKVNPGGEEKQRLEQLAHYRELTKEGQKWLEILPEFIAIGGRRTYLLLLQNNMEIRPTGGFIGSFGLLTFENGRLADLKIEDIYTADGQLKGHVDPPGPIQKYLGKEHWFLRDANWDPDFPSTAKTAEWFLEKEIGIKTDGVLAFDLNLAQKFLDVLGPLSISDYQETVDSKNLFEKTEKYTEEDFFPGSTQKKDFLSALASSLIAKIKTEKGKWPALGLASSQALSERHFLVYFNEFSFERQILQNEWGGSIKTLPCQGKSGCVGDYLLTVEANLGVNKVNYWVKKEIKEEITLNEDGSVDHRLTLNYQNSSTAQTLNGGAYKNYLRIYTPPGTLFEKTEFDGEATESADLIESPTKTVMGFLLDVPPQSKKEVSISYKLPPKFSGPIKSYDFLFQKQAGIQAEPLSIDFTYPSSWQIKDSNFSSLASGKIEGLTKQARVSYNGELKTDKEFIIEY